MISWLYVVMLAVNATWAASQAKTFNPILTLRQSGGRKGDGQEGFPVHESTYLSRKKKRVLIVFLL